MKKCSLPFLILRSFPMLAVAATPFKRSSSYSWPCSFFLFFTVSCQSRKNHGCPYLKCNPLWFSYFSSFISIFSCMHPSSLTLILASQPLSHSHLQARLVIQKPRPPKSPLLARSCCKQDDDGYENDSLIQVLLSSCPPGLSLDMIFTNPLADRSCQIISNTLSFPHL